MLGRIWISVILAIVLASSLSGCGTRYQDMGFGGGVAAQQMTADTFRIISRGNAYTSPTIIQDYTLLKAAEVTKQSGGTHFALISATDASRAGSITTPSTVQTNYSGSTAFSTITPGSTVTYIKPGQDAYIRVLRLAPGTPTPPGVFAADEIIQFVGSRVERPR